MIELFLDKIKTVESSKTAIVLSGMELPYSMLRNKIDELFLLVSTSFDQSQFVVISGDYSFNSIALVFALSKHRCVFVPIISDNQAEISKKIEVSKPDYIIDSLTLSISKLNNIDEERNPYYMDLFKREKSGLVLFSSGSTGIPKAMVHDFDNLLNSYLNAKSKSLTFLVFLMFDHIGGLNTMLNILSMGSTMVIPERREPELIGELIQKHRVNILPASPTFLNLMNIGGIFESYDLSTLKLVTYGTEPMSENLLSNLKSKLSAARFIQTFGTSETGIIKTKSKSSTSLLIRFEDQDQETKIVDGELWIKSKTQVLGYINHSNDSFTNEGWFKTGDLVEEKEKGYYRIVGRKSKVINVGGEKVLPIEVENTIQGLDYILDCTAYAKDNPITGQVVAVKVVVKSLDIDIKQLKKNIKLHCKKTLERYKVPAEIIVSDTINYSTRFKKTL